jgi:hypothetical protein
MEMIIEKLISSEALNVIEESDDNQNKSYKLAGSFMKADIKNQNGRIYPARVVEKEINRYYKDVVTKNLGLAELDHPHTSVTELKRASHIMEELTYDPKTKDVYGKAKALDFTDGGRVLIGFLKNGIPVGVSLRATGTVKENIIQPDFRLIGFDAVANPSFATSITEAILENKDYFFRDNEILSNKVDVFKDSINSRTSQNDLVLKLNTLLRSI